MLWEGYKMETGTYCGFEYGIVFPEEFRNEMPYIWRTEFFGAFPSVDLAMLKEGYAIVYYRISNLYGSPAAVSKMADFQPWIQEKYQLFPKTILFGFSRGGLYALHYAAKYPERIASLYLDAPVVNIYSWPGGFGLSQGAETEWKECFALWNKTREEYQSLVNSAMETIAQSIPLILVAGGKDEIVPYSENGALLQTVYQKSGTPFRVIIKPDCGHHPHSLDDPEPVVKFLMECTSFSEGNAFRINDQALARYPLVLMVHDQAHIELVQRAENIFSGRIPFGYIGTSPWPGSVTNYRTLKYCAPLNLQIYDFLQAQMETGWILYVQKVDGDKESGEILTFLKERKKKYPIIKQIWLKQGDEFLPPSFLSGLEELGIQLEEYGNQKEFDIWLRTLEEEVLRADPPVYFDSFDREWAEWSNFSITLPRKEQENRILLVGDSISAGYGDMVQKRMPEFHVDRLNTSEGIHHPNFLRLLEIALCQYPYRLIHLNNGIHLHGQKIEQYGKNLQGVFHWIHLLSPNTKIVFATTTPLSCRLDKGKMEEFDIHHFSMGDRAPILSGSSGEYWVIDEKASEIYRQLNEKAKEICAARNIPVNDLYAFCADRNLQKTDGVHFQEGAYRKMAGEIAEVLRRELSILP